MKYTCGTCNAVGVKLWRLYNTFLSHQKFYCLTCGMKEYPNYADFFERGDTTALGGGSLVPACPTELPDATTHELGADTTFWGFGSIPGWIFKWWYDLPPKIPFVMSEPVPTREEEEAAKAARREAENAKIRAYIDGTVYVMESTHDEQHHLWLMWHNVLDWKEIPMNVMRTVGYIGEHPVVVAAYFARIEGKLVAFYHPTSRMVDHELVEKWVDETFPIIKKVGRRESHSNTSNWHHCLHAIAPKWGDDKKKKKVYDRIQEAVR